MVPGLWYRAVREVLKRGTGLALPLEPTGPAWWNAAWQRERAMLLASRFGVHLAHVIGTVAEKP
jgi:hypothetical protein